LSVSLRSAAPAYAVFTWLGVSTPLFAQQAAPADLQRSSDVTPPLGILPPSEEAVMDPRMAASWATLPARTFLAVTTDVGFIYLRPRVSVGYGKPYTSWLGLDANPIAQSSGLGVYGGLRIDVPHFDLRIGVRYFSAFSHKYLDARPSYERIDLETSEGTAAKTLTAEAEADVSLPAGPGDILLRGSLSLVSGVPDDQNVFEETLHVIVRPPVVWRTRLGYALRFGPASQHSLGLVADLLDVPKRDDSWTVRVGPIIRMVLSRRVEVRGSFVAPMVSPDRIGLVGGDFTELGVRYRWATE